MNARAGLCSAVRLQPASAISADKQSSSSGFFLFCLVVSFELGCDADGHVDCLLI